MQFQLVKTPAYLALQPIDQLSVKPFHIDFVNGPLGYRLKQKQQTELLKKAIGIKSNDKPAVLDATAGLGRDGFILATLGCEVLMLERSELLAALLADGLKRALKEPAYQNLKIELLHQDAKVYLNTLSTGDSPDVIYLDPMFPERQKSALVKKEMRFLQLMLGNDSDSEELLAIALQHAKKRVVVKRPINQPPLKNLMPQHSINGKNIRFDVYLR